jgi:hypothetical protein
MRTGAMAHEPVRRFDRDADRGAALRIETARLKGGPYETRAAIRIERLERLGRKAKLLVAGGGSGGVGGARFLC